MYMWQFLINRGVVLMAISCCVFVLNGTRIQATQPVAKKEGLISIQRSASSVILKRKEIPILCYHQIRDFKPTDGLTTRDYIVPPAQFKAQIKMLYDSGFTAILPDQLMDYLEKGKLLPSKPVMLTFDDNDANQFEFAKPIMDKYGFKAVYFIMTVSINKKNYFSTKQVKQLADEGNVIGSHTWDHKNIKKYDSSDWERQIDKPRKLLEEITGKPVNYFAFPFGVWNKESIPELKKRKFRAAFQLGEKVDNDDPLFTIRRIIVPGSWSAGTTYRVMQRSFK
jgi:peptidoglycan/xylan/chitin deacetylase (PgdA/CDA1 family)